jgi:hypothetical protein
MAKTTTEDRPVPILIRRTALTVTASLGNGSGRSVKLPDIRNAVDLEVRLFADADFAAEWVLGTEVTEPPIEPLSLRPLR